jgi:hypothetical protein
MTARLSPAESRCAASISHFACRQSWIWLLPVTGARAGGIGLIAVIDAGGRIVARGDAVSLRAQLQPNQTCRLSITFNGGRRSLDVPFTATADTRDGLSILALD